jgi:hypothetical protein
MNHDKGKKRTCEGQHIGSLAKISREGPSIYSEASQHTDNFSTSLLLRVMKGQSGLQTMI